jgi:hypothetical protein
MKIMFDHIVESDLNNNLQVLVNLKFDLDFFNTFSFVGNPKKSVIDSSQYMNNGFYISNISPKLDELVFDSIRMNYTYIGIFINLINQDLGS